MKTSSKPCVFTLLLLIVLSCISFQVCSQTIVRDINSNYLGSVPPAKNINYQIVETNQFNYDGCSVDWKLTNSSNHPNGQTITRLGNVLDITWSNINENAVAEAELKNCDVPSLNGKKATYTVPIRYLGPPGYITINGGSYSNPKEVPCGVQTITITLSPVTNADTYEWNFGNIAGWSSSGNTATITATTSINSAGSISVKAKRSDAPDVSSNSSLNITRAFPNPPILNSYQSLICSGSTTVTVNSQYADSYTWEGSTNGNVLVNGGSTFTGGNSITLSGSSYTGNLGGTVLTPLYEPVLTGV